ncbi:MAG: MarR family transcriptional regulator [Alphaproteobacteria bacterium]|jgi:DNA-binding MarR family transcriptional regulator|nr:MarR family transcriptional regulator [Alphaproteobacteria bacterium]MBU2042148.1 MarR family transcriptional regulator [Alphaproteobacteria bacterium]MBU2126393.1 MarR family transcriptional regulator [Alphaproteobacteria bacterium]MBU2209782.1 MarR family transcriptional regulator [Alphaproteobacteria bacterium]MBU2292099.1 MarR family transcriptional regulator [Alphaproteobacteria bacterium]
MDAASAPERPERLNDPTASLVRSMRKVAQAIDVRSREIARLTGLTLPQMIVLQAVETLGEVTTQAISRDASMSPPTVVAVLDRLEARGMVVRYRSTLDRRVVHARLTEAGRDALAGSPGLLGPGFIAAFAAMPLETRAEVAGSLDVLAGLMAREAGAPAAGVSPPPDSTG